MKRTHGIALLIVAMAFVGAALNGCASNPADRYYELQSSANVARGVILKAHEAGLIDNSDLVEMDQYEKAVRASLDAVRSDLPVTADGKIDADAAKKLADDQTLQWHLDLARHVIDALIAHYGEIHAPTTQPTTEPTP